MSARNPPKYQGTISTWKDEQGFGFVNPNGGGPAVFVHIKSFTRQGTRPAIGDIVTYFLTVNERGQPRAENVAFLNAAPSQRAPARSAAKTVAALGFLALIAVMYFARKIPMAILFAYVTLSVMTFLAYAIDKSAATKNRWRTKESTLHLLALCCGWPGGLMAQQILRHKSQKKAFLSVFWSTVVLNCIALGWLLSPYGADWLPLIFQIFPGR